MPSTCCVACDGHADCDSDFMELFRPFEGADCILVQEAEDNDENQRVMTRFPRSRFHCTQYLRTFLKPNKYHKPLTFDVRRVCRSHLLGRCPRGAACTMLHPCRRLFYQHYRHPRVVSKEDQVRRAAAVKHAKLNKTLKHAQKVIAGGAAANYDEIPASLAQLVDMVEKVQQEERKLQELLSASQAAHGAVKAPVAGPYSTAQESRNATQPNNWATNGCPSPLISKSKHLAGLPQTTTYPPLNRSARHMDHYTRDDLFLNALLHQVYMPPTPVSNSNYTTGNYPSQLSTLQAAALSTPVMSSRDVPTASSTKPTTTTVKNLKKHSIAGSRQRHGFVPKSPTDENHNNVAGITVPAPTPFVAVQTAIGPVEQCSATPPSPPMFGEYDMWRQGIVDEAIAWGSLVSVGARPTSSNTHALSPHTNKSRSTDVRQKVSDVSSPAIPFQNESAKASVTEVLACG